MKRINPRHPRYVLPLLALPFLVLINYLWLDMAPAPAPAQVALTQTDSLNTLLPDAHLGRRAMKDKFGAFQDEFKYRSDYSAMQELDAGSSVEGRQDYGSAYSAEERRLLDSLHNRLLSPAPSPTFIGRVTERLQPPGGQFSAPASRPAPARGYAEQMQLFREQMMFIDSLSRAGEPSPPPPRGAEAAAATVPVPAEAPLPVVKASDTAQAYFNTLTAAAAPPLIRAMLDEGLRVKPGGRIRIRLLDEIRVGRHRIGKDTYLYGKVTGFHEQRVEITVGSLLWGSQVLPLDLRVHDNDGLPGLYVPDSDFRDFTRELAGSVSGMPPPGLQQDTEKVLYQVLGKLSQTTSRAAQRAMRRQKARLKYNTMVYLIAN